MRVDELLPVDPEPFVCFVDLPFAYGAHEKATELLELHVGIHTEEAGDRSNSAVITHVSEDGHDLDSQAGEVVPDGEGISRLVADALEVRLVQEEGSFQVGHGSLSFAGRVAAPPVQEEHEQVDDQQGGHGWKDASMSFIGLPELPTHFAG